MTNLETAINITRAAIECAESNEERRVLDKILSHLEQYQREEKERADPMSQALNEGDGSYKP